MIIPCLHSAFDQSSFHPRQICPADLLRVTKSINDKFNHYAAPGLPLPLGLFPELLDFANWPEKYSKSKNFEEGRAFKSLITKRGEVDLSFAERNALELYNRVTSFIPEEVISRQRIRVLERWHLCGETEPPASHLDEDRESATAFTAIVTTPFTTEFYPELGPYQFLDLEKAGQFDHNAQTVYRPQSGEAVLFNNNLHSHTVPVNKTKVEDWKTIFAGRDGIENILDEDHLCRLRVTLEFDVEEEWLDTFRAQLSVPALSLA